MGIELRQLGVLTGYWYLDLGAAQQTRWRSRASPSANRDGLGDPGHLVQPGAVDGRLRLLTGRLAIAGDC